MELLSVLIASLAFFVSIPLSLGALVVARRSANAAEGSHKEAKRSGNIARDALAESRRSATAAEDSAVSAQRSADAAERQAAAAEAALPPPPPRVAWHIKQITNGGYAMQNVGTEAATGVKVHEDRSPALHDVNVDTGRIGPGRFVTFMVLSYAEAPEPHEIWVSWDGQREPVAVPMP